MKEAILNSNMADPRSVIQVSSPRVLGNLGSWIHHAILKLNVHQYFDVALHKTILKHWAVLDFNMVRLCGHDEMI